MQNRKSIGKWISIIYRQSQIYLNNELKPYNLNSSEYIYLVNVAENEGVNQKFLSNLLIIDDALTTRVMRSLEKKGYIIREKSQEDRRSYNIRLSEKGREIQPIILEKLANWTDILARNMEEEEITAIIDKLKMMSNNALLVTKGENYGNN